jgi:hypothetical protein
MPCADELTFIFHRIKQAKAPIKILNAYKGIPLVDEVGNKDVSADGIRVKTNADQIVCLYREKHNNIQNTQLRVTIRASVRDLDNRNLETVLTGFSYIVGDIGNRSVVRVEPKEPIDIYIQNREQNQQINLPHDFIWEEVSSDG